MIALTHCKRKKETGINGPLQLVCFVLLMKVLGEFATLSVCKTGDSVCCGLQLATQNRYNLFSACRAPDLVP